MVSWEQCTTAQVRLPELYLVDAGGLSKKQMGPDGSINRGPVLLAPLWLELAAGQSTVRRVGVGRVRQGKDEGKVAAAASRTACQGSVTARHKHIGPAENVKGDERREATRLAWMKLQ